MCVCFIGLCKAISISISVSIYLSIYLYIYIYTNTCVYIYIYTHMYIHIWGCAKKGGCRVPRHNPSATYPLKRQPVTYALSRSIHVFCRTKINGYVAKTSLRYIPYVTGYVTGVGQGPCYKPIVLARAHICVYIELYRVVKDDGEM